MKHTLVFASVLLLVSLGNGVSAQEQKSPEYNSGVKVTELLSTSSTSLGKPMEYPQTSKPKVTALEVEMAPGKQTGWHTHPFPTYGYILSGELMVQVQGGKRLHYEAGHAFAEVVEIPHNGINMGNKPVRLVVFFTGEAEKPYTVRSREK